MTLSVIYIVKHEREQQFPVSVYLYPVIWIIRWGGVNLTWRVWTFGTTCDIHHNGIIDIFKKEGMFLLGGVGGGGHHLFLFVNEVRKFIALPPILDLAVLTYIYRYNEYSHWCNVLLKTLEKSMVCRYVLICVIFDN